MKSRTGETVYRVYPLSWQGATSGKWYETMGCDCRAGENGYPACWHKGLVHLLREGGELPTR